MEESSVKALISFHQTNNNSQTNLWIMYVAATMAAAGLGFSSDNDIQLLEAILASIGFLAFTTGQAYMVKRAILVQDSIELELKKYESGVYKPIIDTFISNKLTWKGAIQTHCVIDSCVVLILMHVPLCSYLTFC